MMNDPVLRMLGLARRAGKLAFGDELVRDYFTRPNYWLIDGKAYFSVYDVQKFVESFADHAPWNFSALQFLLYAP